MASDREAGRPAPLEPTGGGGTHPPRLSDDEVRAVLARAARYEVRAPLPSPHAATLEDLVAAAEEVGLDGAVVRRAAAIHPAPHSTAQALLWGAPAGRTVTGSCGGRIPEDREDLARLAESVTGRRGHVVESKPDRWEWESEGGLVRTRVRLEQADGDVRLTVESSRAAALALTLGSLFVGTAAASGALNAFAAVAAAAGPLAAIGGLLAVPLVLTRLLFPRGARGAGDELEHLAMEVVRSVESAPGQAGA